MDWYVEIGGEVKVSGHNQNNRPWRIGIDWPDPTSAPGESLVRILHLESSAIATSGDYRNFHRGPDGRHISHILDPRTNRPVTHNLASATIIAPTCMEADGIATAIMVMGPKQGKKWIQATPHITGLLVIKEDGQFTVWESPEGTFLDGDTKDDSLKPSSTL